jgi:N-acetylglucosamine kinase-like BadF-type ATPase
MPDPQLLMGVDGGNTKTLALVARPDGTIVGRGRSGCGDVYGAASEEEAVAAIEEAACTALISARATSAQLRATSFSLAGADWPEDIEFLREAMRSRGLGEHPIVVNDALGALRGGSDDGTGVAVNCGTGLAVGARNASGAAWHGSFWLRPNGGQDMAVAALSAVVRSDLGLETPTSMTRRALAEFEAQDVEDLLHMVTVRTKENRAAIDPATRILLDEADAGDAVAGSIVNRIGSEIAEYALVAAVKTHLAGPWTLVLAGGVFRHPTNALADAISGPIRARHPKVQPVRARFEPVVGALLLAFDGPGIPVTDDIVQNIESSLPPASFFATL